MPHVFENYFADKSAETKEIEESNKPIKPEEKRVIGKVIKVSEKGWGFISSRDIKFTRIFFHWTSLRQDTLRFPDLKIGMQVEFSPVEVPDKGMRAIKIKVVTPVPTDDTKATT